MTGYNPLFLPGVTVPMTASAPVTAGALVAVTGSGTVGPVTVGGQQWVGVAAQDTPATDRVTVYGRGPVHRHPAEGVITAGDELAASAVPGRAVVAIPPAAEPPSAADVEASRTRCGIALTTAADGGPVTWMAL